MPEFYGEFAGSAPGFDRKPPDTKTVDANPLHLDIDDDELVRVIDERINASVEFYNDKEKIKERRARNKAYLFGKQLKEDELKYYNARYIDNIPYEAEGIIKPIALSKLPDLLVKPATPAFPTIESDHGALVSSGNHASRVPGVDPQGVIIVAAR